MKEIMIFTAALAVFEAIAVMCMVVDKRRVNEIMDYLQKFMNGAQSQQDLAGIHKNNREEKQ
jgi:hypothetical protein